jgi:hypothetical protein
MILFKLSIAYIGPPLPQLSALVNDTVPPILTKLQKIPSKIPNNEYFVSVRMKPIDKTIAHTINPSTLSYNAEKPTVFT